MLDSSQGLNLKPLGKIVVVGPLPPPAGGMANQTRQLTELLGAAQANVTLVQTNAPYRPAWIERIPAVRAGFFIGKKRVNHDVAAKWRATRWWGFDLGDPGIVVWGSPIERSKQDHIKLCSCGRTLPLLKEIQGRSTDFVVTANGTAMHGLSLVYILRDLPGMQSFKVVQESLALTRVLIVVDDSFAPESLQLIVDGFKKRLGESVQVVIDRVDAIPAEKSGKFRYIVSHVAGATRT